MNAAFPTTLLSGIALALTLGAFEASADARPADRPNIILIMTDDQGYGDVGFHGNDQVETPHIDRLADESVELRRFYASPVCAPTRASLMTGRYHYRTGVLHTSRGAAKMHGDETTLAELLEKAGYRTGIFGKWHLGDNYPMRPMDQGFQESLVHKSGGIGQTPDRPNDYFDPKLWRNGAAETFEGYCTDIFTDAAVEFISQNGERPFFIYLSTNAPHSPLIVDEKFSRPYESIGLSADLAKVYGMVTNIDENVGRLLSHLETSGLEENTIVIFMTDNGPAGPDRYNAGLRSTKGSVYDGGIRVPFLIKWPEKLRAGRKIDALAAHVDVLPTLMEAAGVPLPSDLSIDGRSVMPLLLDEEAVWPDRMLFFQWHRGMAPQAYQNAAVRGARYKLVSDAGRTDEWPDGHAPPNPEFELYDMAADPGETTNVAAEHPSVVAAMKNAYDAWFEDVRAARGFRPGLIHIGSDREHPTRLCRYQDATYVDGVPEGWPVRIERGGRYEISINRDGHMEPAALHVTFNGASAIRELEKGVDRATFELPPGTGVLDVWLEMEGQGRIVFTDNDTLGDVEIALLER